MLQIIFSSCKEDAFEFVGRVSYHSCKYEGILSVNPSIDRSSDSGSVLTFKFDVDWPWSKADQFISTLKTIAFSNDLHVEVIGVLFN